jgi:hypothetical protein
MNRAEWIAEYRKARSTARLVQGFRERTGEYPKSLLLSTPYWFDYTRLHGDWLKFRTLVASGDYKLFHCRLPVRLPS